MSPSLDRDHWQRIDEVLDAALAREPEHWPAVLDTECAGAPELRREVEDLLRRVGEARGFLESPPAVAAAAILETHEAYGPVAGRRIGAYSIVREIGRGGMSRVFLACRADGQFEQHVALKLLRPGLDTELDRARFRVERQILASLNHPNIARLLDGGITDAGQPFLALEYVEGHPIDTYCEQHALTVRQRLELFLAAAEATQHAHRNLIIHRDIKSSNIFVSVDGVVKLLDFGLAKLLEPSGYAAESSMTHTGARWMTPEYAAPEQITHAPITTLTDVYQLGAVLYRILSGRVPFTVRGGDLRELEAAVLHGDPAPPSVAVADSHPSRIKALRGDLDAIVLKALRKEPAERFASVEALADDVRRYLSGHPVLARRITAIYRARRFVRRHRIETVAALAISASVLGGAGFSMLQARRAAAERDLAAIASRESQAVTSFVMGLFETSDPAEAQGDTLTAGELVRRAAARAERLQGQPQAQARMLEVTGQLYQSLGQYHDAYAVLERAISIRRAKRGGDSGELAATLAQLSDALLRLGQYAAADSVARETLRLQQDAPGPKHAAAAAVTLHQIASIAVYRGELSVAEAYQRRALSVRQAVLGANDSLTAESHLSLGAILRAEGRMSDAERESRLGLAIMERTVSPDSPQLADAMLAIAYLLDEVRARYSEAEPLYRRALAIRRRSFGDGHPMVAASLLDLAEFLSHRGNQSEAIAQARRAVEIVRRDYGSEHPTTVVFEARLAGILHHAGQLDEATALFRQAIVSDRRLRGSDHETMAGLEVDLARLLIDRRDYHGAESLVLDAVRIRQRASGPNAPGTAATKGLLGMLMMREGRYPAADSILRRSLATMERQVGRAHPTVRELYGWLADLEDARGRHADAVQYRAIADTR